MELRDDHSGGTGRQKFNTLPGYRTFPLDRKACLPLPGPARLDALYVTLSSGRAFLSRHRSVFDSRANVFLHGSVSTETKCALFVPSVGDTTARRILRFYRTKGRGPHGRIDVRSSFRRLLVSRRIASVFPETRVALLIVPTVHNSRGLRSL